MLSLVDFDKAVLTIFQAFGKKKTEFGKDTRVELKVRSCLDELLHQHEREHRERAARQLQRQQDASDCAVQALQRQLGLVRNAWAQEHRARLDAEDSLDAANVRLAVLESSKAEQDLKAGTVGPVACWQLQGKQVSHVGVATDCPQIHQLNELLDAQPILQPERLGMSVHDPCEAQSHHDYLSALEDDRDVSSNPELSDGVSVVDFEDLEDDASLFEAETSRNIMMEMELLLMAEMQTQSHGCDPPPTHQCSRAGVVLGTETGHPSAAHKLGEVSTPKKVKSGTWSVGSPAGPASTPRYIELLLNGVKNVLFSPSRGQHK